jgi:hypothetical protein
LRHSNSRRHEHGMSLVEVIFATGLLAGTLVTLAQMLALSVSNNRAANTLTYTSILAEEKMEQLRGLTWGYDSVGQPVSDAGLLQSPPETMTSNASGWVDYVDQFGDVLGGGATPLPKTVYIRRWAVEPLQGVGENTIVLHVLVTTRTNRGSADRPGSTETLPGESRLVNVKTRKAQ